MVNNLFVIKVRYNNNDCGYAAGDDYIVYDIHRAAIFRDKNIVNDVKKELQRSTTTYPTYPIEFSVIEVNLNDVL